MQRKLFGKLALTFLALLLSVLLAVDFLAERALRNSYENDGFQQLKSLSRVMQLHPIPLGPAGPQTPEEIAALNTWVAANAASGVRITVISADGRVLADSQSETATMESHAERPEVLEALKSGEGRDTRESVSVRAQLLYYAVRVDLPSGVPVILRLALPMAGFSEQLWSFRQQAVVVVFADLPVCRRDRHDDVARLCRIASSACASFLVALPKAIFGRCLPTAPAIRWKRWELR